MSIQIILSSFRTQKKSNMLLGYETANDNRMGKLKGWEMNIKEKREGCKPVEDARTAVRELL